MRTLNKPLMIVIMLLILTSCSSGGYTVGGVVFGLLEGEGLVLQNNSKDSVDIYADSEFAFSSYYKNGNAYDVTISVYPTGMVCTINNGSGSISNANVTDIRVACSTNGYTVGGTVAGLSDGETVTLQNNLGNDLEVSEDGDFTFSTAMAVGSFYDVTVLSAPTGKTCSVSSNEGYIRGENVTDVAVVCSTDAYNVGGTVTGLETSSGLVLQNNLDDDLAVAGDGAFTFDTQLADGSVYDITVSGVPDDKFYNLSNIFGVVSGADVTDVGVKLCALSNLTEIKVLTSDSTPALADLDSPIRLEPVGDYMVLVTSGAANGRSTGTTYLIDPLTYETLDSYDTGYQSLASTAISDDEIWVLNNDGTATALRIVADAFEVIEDSFDVIESASTYFMNNIVLDTEGFVWVLNNGANIWKIDAETREIVFGPLFLGYEGYNNVTDDGMVIDSYGYLWVNHWYENPDRSIAGFVSKVDVAENEVMAVIEIDGTPRGMTADSNGNVFLAYAPNTDDYEFMIGKISSMEESVVDSVSYTYGQGMNLTMDRSGKYVFAAVYMPDREGSMGIFDSSPLREKTYVDVGRYAYTVAVDQYGKIWTGNIYPITEPFGGSVSIIGCP